MRHPAKLVFIVLFAGVLPYSAVAAPDTRDGPGEKPKGPSDRVPSDKVIKLEATRAPEGFVEMFVAGVLPTEGGPAVVLRDRSEKTLLPIWIGLSEAHSIQLRLDRRRFPRPLTHDLLDAIVHELGGEVVKIHVDDVRGETFMGTVFVKKGDKVQHFDARPSDSIALAVGNHVPIFVSRTVIERLSSKRSEGKAPAMKDDSADDDPGEEDGEEPAKSVLPRASSIQTM